MAATFTVRELLDDYVRPTAVRFDAEGHYNAFMALIGVIPRFLDTKVDIPIPDLGGAAEAGASVVAALSPINTTDALKEIAKAVSEAEKALNVQNLAVLNGKVNVQLVVKVGELAGAHASFDLAIGPAPQG